MLLVSAEMLACLPAGGCQQGEPRNPPLRHLLRVLLQERYLLAAAAAAAAVWLPLNATPAVRALLEGRTAAAVRNQYQAWGSSWPLGATRPAGLLAAGALAETGGWAAGSREEGLGEGPTGGLCCLAVPWVAAAPAGQPAEVEQLVALAAAAALASAAAMALQEAAMGWVEVGQRAEAGCAEEARGHAIRGGLSRFAV